MALDERQQAVKKVFTRKQLKTMSIDDLVRLVGEAGPNAKFRGTAIVKRANGLIKYDDDAEPGKFFESQEELAAHAAAVT